MIREDMIRQYLREREAREQLRDRQRDQERRELVAERVAAMMRNPEMGPPGIQPQGMAARRRGYS